VTQYRIQNKGIVKAIRFEFEKVHPETKVGETFEKGI